MTKDKRIGWLANLKVGDKVIVRRKYGTTIDIVQEITPDGHIYVWWTKFNPDGHCKVTHDVDYQLIEATSENIDKHIGRDGS